MSGSGVQLPKWKSYTLGSWEQNNILREPPKSIHTRKKERVDISDTLYMIREGDDSRINEGVSYLARGVNPHVDVMYNNVGGGGGGHLTTMRNIQASNPYKVMKDGAFRPPMFTQEDLLPLSRQKHPESAVSTNPGIRNGFNIHNIEQVFDKEEVKSSIDVQKLNYIGVRPTAMYKMQLPTEVFDKSSIVNDPLRTAAISAANTLAAHKWSHDNEILQAMKDPRLQTRTTNLAFAGGDVERSDEIDLNNYIKDNIILKNISPNFSVLIYNPSTQNYSQVFASTRDRLNIAVQSSLYRPIDLTRDDGTPIKIKDYRYNVVTSAVGGDNLVIFLQNAPDMELTRNTPLYAVGSNMSGNTKTERFHTVDPITDNKVKSTTTSQISMKYGRNDTIHDRERNVNLRGMGTVGGIENFGSVPSIQNHNIPVLNNERMSVKQKAAEEMGNRFRR